MAQHESLFDTEFPAWRLEIRVKFGGGPFDPAGFSVTVVDPRGALVGMVVHKDDTRERMMAQAYELLGAATEEFQRLMLEETLAELKRWPEAPVPT